jgi:hypothetical protein
MRYYSQELLTNSRHHRQWFGEIAAEREHFHNVETNLAQVSNTAALLPRDAWRELDDITMRVMRNDEGGAFMADLMPLARPIDIGKIVAFNRVSSDAGHVVRSISGQASVEMDKVDYDYRATPVPIFASGYGREWREWNTHQSENFDAISDDQESTVAAINRDMARYVLNGDDKIKIKGFEGFGIKNHPLTKPIELGSGSGGADINLTSATSDAIEAFVNNVLGAALDDNHIGAGVNMYVSPEIGRNLDKPYSGAAGFKTGSLRDALVANRRINKIEVTFELSGNEFFAFVPDSRFIRPLVGAAVSTVAIPRDRPMANYQFQVWGAMGIEIRGDFNNRSGVFYGRAT